MSRISRLVILVTSVAAVVGAMAGTASAITWHVSGTGTFTATTGPGTLDATNSSLTCPGPATATGSYPTGATVNPIYSISGAMTFTGCLMAGQPVEMTCGYTFTATTQPTSTTITTGVADVTCGVTLVPARNFKVCHISGAVHAIYHNRSSGADTLTFTTTSTLLVQGILPACPLGPNDTGHLNETTFTITSNSGNGPNIVRTA